jgi:hypothetical protein
MRFKTSALAAACVLSLISFQTPTVAGSSTLTACRPVVNPYAGTRYEGTNLSRITAVGVSCRVARHVAREAHNKALRITPSPSGIRRFVWHRWRVRGDLRPAHDEYVAVKDGKRVTWRF